MPRSRKCRHFFEGKLADSGAVAVEFSLIAPVLLVLVLGVAETCRALLAYRNVAQMTQSLTWTTKALVIPPTSKKAVTLPSSANTVLDNIIFVMQGATAPQDLSVSVRYLAKSMSDGSLSETVLYKTPMTPANDNSGIDTNMMSGDTRIVVQSLYNHKLLFGFFGVSLSLSSRYSM
jgi:Flp pilus assembly protein TadG